MERRVVAVVGPTASGKSDIAFLIAKELKTEIISADSRQIFKELNIGTAKPSKNYLDEIKHHFIDTISITEKYDVGKFVDEARLIIKKLHDENKIPVVVGGSGLYIHSLLYGIFEGPEADDDLRKSLEKEIEKNGIESLVEKLKSLDPETYSRIDKNNPRRIIRAIEVIYKTGKPISQLQKQTTLKPDYDVKLIGLNWDRKVLYERINSRVDKMIANGLVDEVRKIIDQYGSNINIILYTVGYKEVIEYFNGNISMEEMIQLIKRNTRRYAKRQMTWFRKNKEIIWMDVKSESEFPLIAQKIIQTFK